MLLELIDKFKGDRSPKTALDIAKGLELIRDKLISTLALEILTGEEMTSYVDNDMLSKVVEGLETIDIKDMKIDMSIDNMYHDFN